MAKDKAVAKDDQRTESKACDQFTDNIKAPQKTSPNLHQSRSSKYSHNLSQRKIHKLTREEQTNR
ncbi:MULTISPECIES: hypothetical protein [Martelella]|uniref:hypothetical protein n=1 Tax=Martelella TaxID=293088 RepID=UPI0012BAED7F|nr:hypothetical protein [Martelella mediterranea]